MLGPIENIPAVEVIGGKGAKDFLTPQKDVEDYIDALRRKYSQNVKSLNE